MNPALTGTWEMIRAESGGEHSLELLALRVELELTGAAYTVRFGGQIADRGTIAIASPSAFTLSGTEGPNLGRTIPCIYQLVGNRLRICYGMDGIAPTAFASPAGSTHYLATYRRKTPCPPGAASFVE
ncbi:MAG: TIGR03067 domain-containing protein [Opitutaceae bacterium]|nr:TIGR03067 domain-containing protein [Opitutaceae bacterium]